MGTTRPPGLHCPAPRIPTATTPVLQRRSITSSGARITTSHCSLPRSATSPVAALQLCLIPTSSLTVRGSAAVPISVRMRPCVPSAPPAPRRPRALSQTRPRTRQGLPSCGTRITSAKSRPTMSSPVVITVPAGQTLQINLTNSLSFAAGGGTNTIPTSLTIVGQLGGGLGTTATSTVSPPHATQGATWPVADASTTNDPAAQGPRVQSFSTEVAAGVTPTSLTWTAPRPGTYLLESGTHPSIQGPMGLYRMVVVPCAPTGTAGCPVN